MNFPKQQTQASLNIPSVVKNLTLGEWNIKLTFQDHLLSVECHSLEHEYALQKQISEVPKQFSGFCQNLSEFAQFLAQSGSLKIANQSLLVSCQVGKLLKHIQLELDPKQLSLEIRLINTQKLLEIQKQKVAAAKKQIARLQEQLQKEKKVRTEFKQFLDKYSECAKYGCSNLVKKESGLIHFGKYVCREECKWHYNH